MLLIGSVTLLAVLLVALPSACANMAQAVGRQLQTRTPVFDASVQRLVDFGDRNLSDFVRFYAFYADLRQTLSSIDTESCTGIAAEAQLVFMISQMRNGLGYYAQFAPYFPVVQFTPEGIAMGEGP